MLALTRPELSQVTAMLLKSRGFKHSEELSDRVQEAMSLVREELGAKVHERDDWFSLTSRGVRRLVEAASGLARTDEFQGVAQALRLFIGESVAAYVTQTGLDLEATTLQVTRIIEKVFGLHLSNV